MALIVGGTTVTGTQTLEASTLTGTASAINGSNITNIPAADPSTAQVGSAAAGLAVSDVGNHVLATFADGGDHSVQSTRTDARNGSLVWNSNTRYSGSDLSGTWKNFARVNNGNAYTVMLRVS